MSYKVEYPKAEYHEIVKNLWLGGSFWDEEGAYRDGRHSALYDDPSWDFVVLAYLDSEHINALPQCDTRLVLFNDTEKGLDNATWSRIMSAVSAIVEYYLDDAKILVKCQAGFNRSGLIMALALINLGYSADDAIAELREKRSPYVLINPVFEKYVRNYYATGRHEDEVKDADH